MVKLSVTYELPRVLAPLMEPSILGGIVTTPNGTGVICAGADGRCDADAPLLLPIGWSVLSIDVARGCIRFALNDEPQDLFCIA